MERLFRNTGDVYKRQENYEAILNGNFSGSLIGSLQNPQRAAMNAVKEISSSEIYAHRLSLIHI